MAGVDLAFAIGLEPAKAVEYFEGKGYALGFKWQDVWAEAHAKAFTVTGVMKLDILQDVRQAMADQLKNGGTLTDFQNQLQPTLESKGWWGKGQVVDPETGEVLGKRLNPRRLETIFRTNMQSAYMAGRYQQQLANAEARPYWEYVAVLDGRTRPAHRALAGRVFRYDDPFWQSFYPPNGWNCRCRVRTRSARDIERNAIAVSDSKGRIETIDQPVGRTGETRPAPAYHDPATGQRFVADAGFGYNPGRVAWQPQLDKYAPATARQYVKGALTGPDFGRWYGGLEKAVKDGLASGKNSAALRQELSLGQRHPVAVLGDTDRALLGTESQTVWLSDDTLIKQLAHREGQAVDLAHYWIVQEVLENAQSVLDGGDRHIKFLKYQERWWVAVIKTTQSGKANFLQSFYPTNEKEISRLKNSGKVLREG